MIKRISTMTIIAAFILSSISVFAGTPTVDEILQKNIAARGGDKLKNVQTYSSDMSMEVMGMNMTMKSFIKLPDKSRVEFSAMGQDGVVIINGEKGWVIQGGAAQDLPADQMAQSKKQFSAQTDLAGRGYLDYKEKGIIFELEGIEDVNGTSTYKVKETQKDGTISRIYFSTKDCLEVKRSSTMEMQGQTMDMDIVYKENKLIDGVLVPVKMEMVTMGMNSVVNITDFKINPTLDDKLFNP
jgi:outer membrane lipoprotein-sorting protein